MSDARSLLRRPFEGLGSQPVLLALIVLMEVAFALIEPRIISRGNMLNVMQQASYLVIFTVAQTLVILTRGFDLSLGTTVSAVGVASALVLVGHGEDPAWWVLAAGIAVGLAFGLAVGLFNGLLVAAVGVNPFIATLASLNICLGLATTISGGKPVFGVPDSFSDLLADDHILGVRVDRGYRDRGHAAGMVRPDAHGIWPGGLYYRRQPARRIGSGSAGAARSRWHLRGLLAAGGAGRLDADRAHRFGGAQPRRQPDASEHRGGGDRRREPARR